MRRRPHINHVQKMSERKSRIQQNQSIVQSIFTLSFYWFGVRQRLLQCNFGTMRFSMNERNTINRTDFHLIHATCWHRIVRHGRKLSFCGPFRMLLNSCQVPDTIYPFMSMSISLSMQYTREPRTLSARYIGHMAHRANSQTRARTRNMTNNNNNKINNTFNDLPWWTTNDAHVSGCNENVR